MPFRKITPSFRIVLSILTCPILPLSIVNAACESPSFTTVGKINNPFLLDFIQFEKQKKCPHPCISAVIIDGSMTQPQSIAKHPAVQTALASSTPIIISNTTTENLHALTGAGIGKGIGKENIAIVIPKKNGEEFEINLLQNHYGALGKKHTHIKKKKIDEILKEQKRPDGDKAPPYCGDPCHKRWTIRYIEPHKWGNQGQFIDVGFQYDLYYVTDPFPARKYLTVQSVGKGVSPGTLKKDTSWHRGYFQNEVSVSIESFPGKNWTSNDLHNEGLAPESDNRSNTYAVSTGLTFLSNLYVGATAYPSTGSIIPYIENYLGFSLSRTYGKSSSFSEFAVTLESSAVPPNSTHFVDKWTYWLNGSAGTKITRGHPKKLSSSVLHKIIEIPELGKSILRPHMEAVYYTNADENGTLKMVSTVKQELVSLKSRILYVKDKKIHHSVTFPFDIDFGQVTPPQPKQK